MDQGGCYEHVTRETFFRHVVDTQFAVAMCPPGGGSAPPTQRFLSHFNQIACLPFAESSLVGIFDVLAQWGFRSFNDTVMSRRDAVVAASLSIFQWCIRKMLPTPSKPLYKFNLRDLSRLFQGLLSVNKKVFDLPPPPKVEASQNDSGVASAVGGAYEDGAVNDEDDDVFLDEASEEESNQEAQEAPVEKEQPPSPAVVQDPVTYARRELMDLWVHETSRTFADRMMTKADLERCASQIKRIAINTSSQMTIVPICEDGAVSLEYLCPMYGTFMGDAFNDSYCKLGDLDAVGKSMVNAVEDHNSAMLGTPGGGGAA